MIRRALVTLVALLFCFPVLGQAVTVSPTIPVGQIAGTITNDNATAGNIGEQITASVVAGSAVALTTNAAKTVTSIPLTAGDWDVCGNVGFSTDTTTSLTQLGESLSLTTDTLDTTAGVYSFSNFVAVVPGLSSTRNVLSPLCSRFSFASTTSVFLVAFSTHTVSTNAAYGKIWARRRR